MTTNALVQTRIDGAIKEARKGKLASFKNVKDLMNDLNADD
jgi:antitoxin component of RelBE/YafQ-DinJ toxin-antitoxin module